jgi:hypothetical protein
MMWSSVIGPRIAPIVSRCLRGPEEVQELVLKWLFGERLKDDEATSLLERVRRRIESYAGDDPELRRIAEDLRVDFGEYAMPMTPMIRKGRYYEASNLLRNRDALGMARREKAPR